MPSEKNRNKIYVTSIICLGIIVSVWLLQRAPTGTLGPTKNNQIVSARPLIKLDQSTNNDWKKILVTANTTYQGSTTDLTKSNDSTFDETSLTAQMARDFMSQYLIAKKGGRTLTTDDINTIATNVMSSPQYTKVGGVVYTESNLHVNPKTDKETIRNYKNVLSLSLKTRSQKITENPAMILTDSTKTGNESKIEKMDLLITQGKGFISDFLAMDVPKDAVTLHLALLNSSSNLLSDIESMREVFTDPVKGLSGVSQYNKHMMDFQNSLQNIYAYFAKKSS